MLSKLQVKSLLAGPLEDFINPLAMPSIVSFENNGFRSFTFDKALSEHHVKAMEALLDPDYMKNEEQKLMDLSPLIQQFKQAVESQDPKEVKNAQLACLASAIFHWLATDLVESAQLGFRRAQAAEKERFLELLDQGDPLYLVLHADDVRSYEETANALQNIFAPSPSEDGTRNWSPALFYFENISEMRQLAKTLQATGELVVQGNLEILAREMELKTVVPYLTEQAKAQGSSEGELEAGVNKLLDNMAKNPDLHDDIARGLVHMTTEMEKHWLHGRIMTRAELYLEQQAIALVQWLQILADDEDPNFCLVMAHSLRQEQHLVPLLQEDFSLGPRFTKPWHQLLTTITKKASPDFSLKLGRSYMAVYDTLIEQYAIQGRGVQAHSVFGLSEHFLSNTDCVQDLIDNHSLLPRLSQWIADYVKRDGHQEPWKRLESEEYVTLKYDRYSPILTDVDHLSKLECFTSRIECPLLKGVADIMVHNASGQSCCNTMEKDYEKAILEYSDALDLTVSHLGQDHPLAVAWQYSIGWCIYGKGDHPAALEKFGEALELSKTALGYLTNPLTATIQVDIGRVHSSLGDYGTSLAAHEAALSLREKVLGDSHIETARSYCEVAGVLRRQGAADNDGRHVALYRQALDVFEKEPNLAGETASIMSLLAAALAEQGDHSGAIEQHRKALTLCVSIHGEDHLETANIHGNLANALKDAGDFEGAMTEYRAGLQIRRSCLDASNPAIGTSLNNIGLLLHENGRYDEALVELKKAIDIYVSSLGPDHPETANAHFNCGLVLWKLQMHDESLAEHRTALAAYSSSGNEPGIAKTLDEIGWALIEMEDLDAALTEYQKLYTVRLSMLGEDHPDTMEVKQIVLDLRGEVPAISNEIDAEQDDGSATTVDATVDTDQVEVVDSDKDLLGVSVHHLQHGLLHEVKEAGLSRESKIYEIEDLRYPAHGVIRRKGASVTCPIDGQLGASYVHSLGDDPDKVGPSHFMISYSWGYCIGDIVDTLVSYCDEQNRDPKSTYIWICCLCVNQHRVQGEDVLPDELASIFGRRVTGIGHVLSMITPWKEPENLGRIWCVFELFKAHTMGCEVTIVMPAKEKVSLESDLLGDEPGSGVELLYGAIAKTKIEEASTSKVADRIAILGWVEEHLGYSELNRQAQMMGTF
ncbi:Hydra magnipapillata [Seminavis robusta]|uniref:Hydra magnipapillata n=1 Tax=Seminavis robusta TaxID=568900 RepID=A0A9N8D7Q6_9STRA|nr:Hydra magnipapillata [Seminavis robusta]|eukprot:Sro9_g007120.1 Hydra magnipapillata (1159) ;mRNA; f:54266-57827